jgi:tetratricopeptide (TPR) repeat protein
MPRRILPGLLLALALLLPSSANAQLPRVDRAYERGDAAASLGAAEALLRDTPGHFGALWRAARAGLVLGILADTAEEQLRWYRAAEGYARRAAELKPERVEGHYWLAAASGRRALQLEGPRTTARLAAEARRQAEEVLRLDPDHAGAHNVLGRLYYEVMIMPAPTRFLARHLLGGGAFEGIDWAAAERHLNRAVVLDPGFILYRLDLARLYWRTGRPADALRELDAIRTIPPAHPPDTLFKREAEALRGEVK